MEYQLKTRQVCLFLIAFTPLTKLFLMPSIMASFAGEDMWISAVVNLILDFTTLFFVVDACKKTQVDFFTLLENKFGKIGSTVILCLYLLYFILKAIIPLTEQRDYVEMTLYTLMPSMLYFLPFFFVAFYFCVNRLRVVGRAADIMWAVTVIAFILLLSLSIANADFTAILPIGANGGVNVLKGSYSSLTWFGDAAYFTFFIGNFKFHQKDKRKIFLSYLLSATIILLFLIIFYAVFTSIAYRQRFGLTEISKYTTVINNIGRFDYLGIMMILLSTMFSLSMPMFFASKIVDRIFKLQLRWVSPLIIVGLELIVIVIFYQFTFSIENFILNYCGAFFFIMGNVLPIIISLTVKKQQDKAVEYESA